MKNLNEKLKQLKARGRLRSLQLPSGIDLTSNDYLGLADHPDLRRCAIEFFQNDGEIGAMGSRLLRGHTQAHQDLEEFSAAFFAAPRALYFANGFAANTAIFQALTDRHGTIIFDEYIHASAREGIQNSHVQQIKVQHNDLNSYEEALKKAQQKSGQIWVAVESVYSMDGDFAPLQALYTLAEKYDAVLIVDEAHGTGVYGTQGRGCSFDLIQRHGYERIITLHTCGKAIGVAGGLVCASADVIDTLINTARAFIYSTAPMPVQAHLVHKSLEIIASADGDARRAKLFALNNAAQKLFGGAGSQVVPIVIGGDDQAVAIAKILQQKGYDIRAIRPPTVPEGTARLRLSLSAALDEKTLQEFARALAPMMMEQAA
jgi:8-amino-7-oxononanoate synthase